MANMPPKTFGLETIPEYPLWQPVESAMVTQINNRHFCVCLFYNKTDRNRAAYHVYWAVGEDWEELFQIEMEFLNENIGNLSTNWQEFTEKFPEMIMEHLL